MSGGSGYVADNTQNTARFGVPPVVKVAVRLANVDRTNGEFFSSFEGEGVYVEQTDFPVFISLIQQNTGKQVSFIAHNGLEIKGSFKGMWISHPLLSLPGLQTLNLSLVLLRAGGNIDYVNQLADPIHCAPPSILTNAFTALGWTGSLYVPQGVRLLREFKLTLLSSVGAPSVTNAYWDSISDDPAALCVAPTIFDPFTQQNFNSSNALTGAFQVAIQNAAAGAMVILTDTNIPIPSSCRMLRWFVAGTNFAAGGGAGGGVKAVFA